MLKTAESGPSRPPAPAAKAAPGVLEYAALVGAAAFVLVLDLLTPLELDIWVSYLVLILASLWFRSRAVLLVTAATCSVFFVLGAWLEPTAHTFSAAGIADLVIGIVTLWTGTMVLLSRRTAVDALVQSDLRFRRLVEGARDTAIILLDPEGRVVTWNAGAESIFGYAAEEIVGQPYERLLPADQGGAPARAELERAAAAGACESTGWRVRRDGARFWASGMVSALSDEDGTRTGFVKVTRDLTDQRREEVRLQAILESAMNSVISVDGRGRITVFNPAAEAAFGYSSGEVVGQNVRLLLPAPWRDTGEEDIARFLSAGATGLAGTRREADAQRKDGTTFPIEMGVAEFRVELDGQRQFAVDVRDLTQRKSLEAQMRQAQKMEAVGRLAGGVAHDFNNLLQIINGYTEMLLDDPELPADARTVLGSVARAGKRAGGLTRQLLAFSRKQVIRPDLVDLGTLVADANKLFRRLLGEDIQVRVVSAAGLWLTLADPGQIEQVLLNLLVNARDAMPDGGVITIETTNVELDAAEAGADLPPGRYVLLAVGDTGTGIPADVLPHIFEPFFTTKDQDRGTGLGLATVHGIVQQSRGTVRVESRPLEGTTFRIYLPANESRRDVEVKDEARAPVSVTGQTILVVEDEPDLRAVVKRLLASAGYRVLAPADPAGALAILSEPGQDIHLLLTDLVMPGMSGSGVGRDARLKRPGLPVIYMSGYTEHPTLHAEALDRSIPLIQKPFVSKELLALVNAQLLARPVPVASDVEAALRPGALVVDDAEMNVTLLAAFLQKLGWTARAAGSAREALELLERCAFDVILLDCLMPEMDGFELTARIRGGAARLPGGTPAMVPIVGVTASAGPEDRRRCLGVGMSDVMAKPVTLSELARMLARWAPRPASAPGRTDEARRLADVVGELGRPAAMHLLDLFREDLRRQVALIRSGLRAGDRKGIYHGAHRVKGSSSNLGAIRLTDAARMLEERASREPAGATTELSALVDAMEQEAGRFEALLDNFK